VTARARAVIVLLVLAGALASAAPTVAQGGLTPEEFAARLDVARDLADRGVDDPAPERMAAVRAELGLPVHVVVEGETVEIADDPLAGLRGTSSADFERASERLAAVATSLEEAVARLALDRSTVAGALEDAFRGVAQPRPNPSEVVLRWIGEAIGWVLHRIQQAISAAGSLLAWLVVLLAAGAVAVLVWRRARLVPDRVVRSGAGAGGAATAVDWSGRADDAIRVGDLREAVRALYLALLESLARRGLLADVPALTAGEARSAVSRSRPALFPAVARATESYERVVYGGAPPDHDDVELLRRADALARRS
jgi:hypothetical protein